MMYTASSFAGKMYLHTRTQFFSAIWSEASETKPDSDALTHIFLMPKSPSVISLKYVLSLTVEILHCSAVCLYANEINLFRSLMSQGR